MGVRTESWKRMAERYGPQLAEDTEKAEDLTDLVYESGRYVSLGEHK